MRIDDDAALLQLRPEYLRAVHEGASEFVAEFRAGTFGHAMADVSLAPPGAHEPPPIDVVLRCDGGAAVLDGVPLQVAARSVTVDGLAFRGALRPALRITAFAAITLRRVSVLGVQADEHQRAVVELGSAAPGTRLSLEACVLADSDAPTGALLGLSILDGAWFDTAELRDVTLLAGRCESVLMIEALRSLDARDCRFGLGGARTLIRMAWPGEHAELSGCTLAAGAGGLLEVLNPAPVEVEPMRLTHGTRVSAALDQLAPIVADDTVVSAPDLAGEIAAAVAAAQRRLAASRGGPGR